MFRFHFQIGDFRFLEQEIFILVIFKTQTESEAEILVPYIGETEFCQMIFIRCIIGTVTFLVNVDIVVLEHIREVEITLLHGFQRIVYAGSISFTQSTGKSQAGRNMSFEVCRCIHQQRRDFFRIETDAQIDSSFVFFLQQEVEVITFRSLFQRIAGTGIGLAAT